MKASLSVSLVVLVAVFVIATWARAQPPIDRPVGVDVENWIAMSDSVGIALTRANRIGTLPSGAQVDVSGAPQRTGVLMAKVNGLWTRIELAEGPPRLQPAH
jgi:hypothetical protein